MNKTIQNISKKYNISPNKIKPYHVEYFYTKQPELCCNYNRQSIDTCIGPFEFHKSITYLNNYYADIKTSYFKDMLDYFNKATDNDVRITQNTICDNIVSEYLKFRKDSFCLTIWPSFNSDITLVKSFLEQYGFVYYIKTINLSYNAARNLVYQLYSDTTRMSSIDVINSKLNYIGWKKSDQQHNIHVIFFENTSDKKLGGSQSQLKSIIRSYLLELVKNSQLRGDDLLHINDYFYQTIEYANIYLRSESLKFIHDQHLDLHYSNISHNSRLYVNTIKKWITKNVHPIDHDRFIFIGGGVLYAYGCRPCRDTEGIVISSNNMRTPHLAKNVAKFFYDSNTKFFFGDIGIYNTVYWKDRWTDKNISWFQHINVSNCDDLIFNPINYFYFNGIKFITLRNEIGRKNTRSNTHDISDFMMLSELFNININPLSSPFILSKSYDVIVADLVKRYNMSTEDASNIIKKYPHFYS